MYRIGQPGESVGIQNCIVFCPGFQNCRMSSEKGTVSAVNGQSKRHN